MTIWWLNEGYMMVNNQWSKPYGEYQLAMGLNSHGSFRMDKHA